MPPPNAKPTTDLTLIILNYNSQFWLKQNLDSLKKFVLTKTNFKIRTIVVDNHSDDDSLALLGRSYRWVDVIELPENIGFAKGNNVGLKQAKSRYIMLINADLEFTADSNLDLLINYMDENPKIGVITPKVSLSSGEIDPACHRGEPTPWATLTYFLKLEALLPKVPFFSQYHQWYKDLAQPHTIDACSGAAMMVRSQALEKVGLLDEQFFMYAEDLDWCNRFRKARYQVMYYPYVELTHHKYKSGLSSQSKATARKTSQHFYDTMLQYYDKHYRSQYPEFVRNGIKYLLQLKQI